MVYVTNRLCEETTSTGAGILVLNGISPVGYTPLQGYSVNSYLIEAVDSLGNPTGDWETGLGWKNVGTDEFHRMSAGGYSDCSGSFPMNFGPGTKRVWMCLNDIMFLPWIAVGERSSGSQIMASANTTAQLVTLQSVNCFSLNFATLASNCVSVNIEVVDTYPKPWCGAVEIDARVEMSGLSAGEWVTLTLKQGSTTLCDVLTVVDPVATGYHVIQLNTPEPVYVSPTTPNFCMYIKTETTAAPVVNGAVLAVKGYSTYTS